MALHIKEITPLWNNILTTGNKYEKDMKNNGIIVAKQGDLKLYQTVLAVGSTVRDIKVGDQIMFSPQRYAVMQYDENSIKNDMGMNKVVKWNLPWVTVEAEDGTPQEQLMLSESDVQFVFKGEEREDNIIIPEKPKFITN